MTTGLVLIDIQNDYFPGGAMELVEMESASAQSALLLDAFRGQGAPTYHIQHFSVQSGATFFVPDSPGVELHPSIAPRAGEAVIAKNFPNAFRETDLAKRLRRDGVDDLLICGAMSHMCIDASTRAAFDLGFSCRVATDACATRDLPYEERTVAAREVHAAFMAALSRPYAQVAPARELLAGL